MIIPPNPRRASRERHQMHVLTFSNGSRALYRGRRAGGCVLVKFQGERFWWWMPEALIKRCVRVRAEALKAA